MSQTDAILGWVDNSGRPFLMDTWIGGYTSPLLDISQDVTNASGSTVDGITTLSFQRKRITQDSKDFSFTDDKCLYLMFPIKGGSFNPVNKKIRKHEVIPAFSSQRVCFRNCAREEDWQSAPTPPRLQYNVEVKLVKLGENFEVPAPGSQDFSILANTVSNGFTKALAKLPGFHKMSVYDFTRDDDNVIARMSLELDEGNYERGRALLPMVSPEEVLNSTVTAGRVGALTLDPAYLVFEPVQVTSTLSDESKEGGAGIFVSATKLYIVLGCIAALVFVALIQAGCTLYKTLRHPPTQHKRVYSIPIRAQYPPQEDYSAHQAAYIYTRGHWAPIQSEFNPRHDPTLRF
ncbi:hypothetical protein M8J76_007174 [Diaphorina citri]|nr:hypothetical protein M8J76_007174 [Diaphorina citri]